MTLGDQMREAMMDLLANMAPVREAVLGYKQSLVDDGFNERLAERMAVEFHAYLVAVICSQLLPATAS